MKRTMTALTATLLLAATAASAQAPQAPATAQANPFSPFVYDVLGATPKIQLRKAQAAKAAAPQQAKTRVARDTHRAPRTPVAAASAEARGR